MVAVVSAGMNRVLVFVVVGVEILSCSQVQLFATYSRRPSCNSTDWDAKMTDRLGPFVLLFGTQDVSN